MADENGSAAWAEQFPEEVRKLEIVRDSPNPETFYKRLQDQQAYVGQALRIPGADAGEDDWKVFNEKLLTKVPTLMPTPNFDEEEQVSAFMRRMGAPEEKAKYVAPELSTEGLLKIEEETMEALRESAFKHKFTQKQFAGFAKDMHERAVKREQDRVFKTKQDRDALRMEWGSAHDEKLQAIDILMVKTQAPPHLMQISKSTDAATLKWLDGLTKAVTGEGKELIGDTGTGRPQTLTPGEAKLKISEIRNNKEHPYHKQHDPGHSAAKLRMRELYILADPSQATQPVVGARHSF